MRLASRSIARRRSTGKSTFTRWTSRPGLRVFDKSRYGVMSPPGSSAGRSAKRSNSSAVIMAGFGAPFARATVLLFFAVARVTDRDEADRFFMAICHRGSPQVLPDLSNHEKARLVRRPSRKFDAVRV